MVEWVLGGQRAERAPNYNIRGLNTACSTIQYLNMITLVINKAHQEISWLISPPTDS